MKKKIKLEEIVKLEEIAKEHDDIVDNIINSTDAHGLYFVKLEEEEYIDGLGLNLKPAKINVFGREILIVMKNRLFESLLDPSSDDLDTLRKARNYARGELIRMFGKKKLDPTKSNFLTTLDDKYTSSLIMNLIKYPTNELDSKNIGEIGLKNPDIKKLYIEAVSAWLGQPVDIDFSGLVGNLEKIISWSGDVDTIDLNIERCDSYSHYILKMNVKEKQEKAQRDAVENETYSTIESKIVNYIMSNCKDKKIRDNAQNLVRMFLNLSCLYGKNKPLPLK